MTKKDSLMTLKRIVDDYNNHMTQTYGRDVYFQQIAKDGYMALRYVDNWWGSDPVIGLFPEDERGARKNLEDHTS